MKPVLMLQHLGGDGPAYLGRWLQDRGVAADVRNAEAGERFPARLDDHAALAVLGGEMSANDELASLRQAEALIRQAFEQGVPVLGHCLGGQLMARAMGARVVASPRPEVGWQPVAFDPRPEACDWFGDGEGATLFQWHYEAFELPATALRLEGNAACPNQAFGIGPHLAMQFHIEVDAAKVERWSREDGPRWQQARQASPQTVQDGAALRAGIRRHLAEHQALADRIYRRWLGAAAR